VLRLFDKETVGKEELAEIFASVPKRPVRVFESVRRRPAKDIPPVLTPNELALLGPSDVADLKRSTNGSANGRSRTRSTANGGSTSNGAAKKTTARRTTKRSG
jgi:cell division protease FtsH